MAEAGDTVERGALSTVCHRGVLCVLLHQLTVDQALAEAVDTVERGALSTVCHRGVLCVL